MLAAVGMAIGLPGGLGLGRLVESQLFGMRALDLTTILVTTAVRRGESRRRCRPRAARARVDPLTALRYE